MLVDPIGEGGMGSVWRAWDAQQRQYVAAKLLRPADAGSLLRFVREQSLRVEHPHVAAPTGWAAEDDQVLLTMDLVRGGSVAHLLGDYGQVPLSYATVLVEQLLAALAAVHAQGIVHRDVKPSNLLLEPTGRDRPVLRLADFGIAAVVGEPRLTHSSLMLGTPGYRAPECVTEAGPLPSQDLYGVGVVAYQLLSGRIPERPSEPPDSLPEPVWAVLRSLLADSPADRPASARATRQQWLDALDEVGPVPPDPDGPDAVEVFEHVGPLPPGFGPAGPEAGGPGAPGVAGFAPPGMPLPGPLPSCIDVSEVTPPGMAAPAPRVPRVDAPEDAPAGMAASGAPAPYIDALGVTPPARWRVPSTLSAFVPAGLRRGGRPARALAAVALLLVTATATAMTVRAGSDPEASGGQAAQSREAQAAADPSSSGVSASPGATPRPSTTSSSASRTNGASGTRPTPGGPRGSSVSGGAAAGTKTVTVGADTTIVRGTPKTANGHNKMVSTCGPECAASSLAAFERRALFRFAVSGLPSGHCPTAVTLRLWAKNAPGGFAVRRAATDWSEETASWSNAPERGAVLGHARGPAEPGWMTVRLPASEGRNGTHAFELDGTDTRTGDFAAREDKTVARPAQLVISHRPCAD